MKRKMDQMNTRELQGQVRRNVSGPMSLFLQFKKEEEEKTQEKKIRQWDKSIDKESL